LLFLYPVFPVSPDHDDKPSTHEEKSPDGRHGTEPSEPRQGEEIETPAKDQDPESPAKNGTGSHGSAVGGPEKGHGVDKVIENGCVPVPHGVMQGENTLQGMGSKGAESNG
jgi:hypothetical protein